MNQKLPLQALIEAAVLAALAYIIDILPAVEPFPWVKISLAMIPVLLLSLRWGLKAGMASGFIWGLLQVVLGNAYILTPLQAFIEYFIAFAFIGLAGLFTSRSLSARKIVLAVFVGCLARYFWHFLAGWVFFGDSAPEGTPAALYSLVINGSAAILTFLACAVVLVLLQKTAPRLFKV